jgi:hypothetical protein
MRSRDDRGRRGGSRDGQGRNGGGGRGRGRSWGNNRRGGGYRNNDPRAAAHSGNRRERISVESGHLVLIDQFMLANPQFIDEFMDRIDQDGKAKDELIMEFGGTVVELTPGTYRIERDPYAYTIVIHPEGDAPETKELPEIATKNTGTVFVDTRCLAMVDRELLDDGGLLDKYSQLWASGQEKACRDLLRDNGGAVRYGFRRYGDELGVHQVPKRDIVCLWPDGEAQPE